MALEVYSATKPALSYRAWVAAVGLLALSLGLATGMTWQRTGARLGEATSPEGWLMSFRIPREFSPAEPESEGDTSFYEYQFEDQHATKIELGVWRIENPHLSATEACDRILQSRGRSFLGSLFGPAATRSRELLGGEDAVEVHDPGAGMVVRAHVAKDGAAYAVSLRADGAPIDEESYALFDITCRSAQFNTQ